MRQGLLVAILMLGAVTGCRSHEHAEEQGPLVISVTGADYQWHTRYPGRDNRLDTDDDIHALGNVHLPPHRPVEMQLHSQDFIYNLSLPHLSLTQIAVPDMEFSLSFNSGPPGTHPLRGDQMCGFSHESLLVDMVVETESGFVAWMKEQEP